MNRITEEAKAVLNCYETEDKQELMAEIEKGLVFVDDTEIKTAMKELLENLRKCTVRQFREMLDNRIIGEEYADENE